MADPFPMSIKNAPVPVSKITQIRLWNTNPDERILLRADGTASYFGLDLSSRPGVGEYRGTFPPEEFRRLADTLTTQGFFRLQEQYTVPDTARHTVYSIAVVRDGQPEKLVFTNGGRVPAGLSRLKAAIHDTVSAVTWREGPSGVRGVFIVQSMRPLPQNTVLTVITLTGSGSHDTELSFRVDKNGHFEMPLPPGSYILRPGLPVLDKPGYITDWGSWDVTVSPNKYSILELDSKPSTTPFRLYRGG